MAEHTLWMTFASSWSFFPSYGKFLIIIIAFRAVRDAKTSDTDRKWLASQQSYSEWTAESTSHPQDVNPSL